MYSEMQHLKAAPCPDFFDILVGEYQKCPIWLGPIHFIDQVPEGVDLEVPSRLILCRLVWSLQRTFLLNESFFGVWIPWRHRIFEVIKR